MENNNSWTLPSAHELDEWAGLVSPGPIDVPNLARKGFGVFVPTNAAPWRLSVTVEKDDLSPSDRLRQKLWVWKSMRKQGCSLYEATNVTWQAVFTTDLEFLESEPITNSIPSSPYPPSAETSALGPGLPSFHQRKLRIDPSAKMGHSWTRRSIRIHAWRAG
jgi:hypothetical protein